MALVIDYISLGIGGGIVIILSIILFIGYKIFIGKKKTKLMELRKIIYESGMGVMDSKKSIDEAYKKLKSLERVFKDLEDEIGK